MLTVVMNIRVIEPEKAQQAPAQKPGRDTHAQA
jgi:hypothetical protein